MRARWLLALLVAACSTPAAPTQAPAASNVPVQAAAPAATPAPATPPQASALGAGFCEGGHSNCADPNARAVATPTAGGDQFGQALTDGLTLTPLSELLATPAKFDGQLVRTAGTIARVCQHKGCWMELRAEVGEATARVPMAGHAFFVPPDSSGRQATVEGRVSVRADTPIPLRIDATGVLIAAK